MYRNSTTPKKRGAQPHPTDPIQFIDPTPKHTQGGCRGDEGALAAIALQALKGLNFLHARRQIHRDIKPGVCVCMCVF